ncbi:Gag-polypeptide of LTR copia-type [Sesbania bispinosa]|nr:Gag-polypeptide of LTR copia-type [Sesbania bispinosa]
MANEHSSPTIIADSAQKSATGIPSLTETNILPITGYKLNGQNYIQWPRSVRIFLQGKGKEDYITSNAKEPEKEDPTHQKWKLENSLVMSWLLSFMTHETGENFMYYGTAVEIWNATKETYSNVDNTSAIFKIKSLLHDLRQGDSSVTEYYHSLTRHKENRAHAAIGGESRPISESEPSPFNKEQMEMIQTILRQTLQNTSTNSSAATLAQKGNLFTVFHILNPAVQNSAHVPTAENFDLRAENVQPREVEPEEAEIVASLEPEFVTTTVQENEASGHEIKELHVYSRKNKSQKPQMEVENCTFPRQNQVSNPSSEPENAHTGNTPLDSSSNLIDDNSDLDLPIALRKGVRSCTQHPIGNYVSFEKLSQDYRAFVTNLDSIKIS